MIFSRKLLFGLTFFGVVSVVLNVVSVIHAKEGQSQLELNQKTVASIRSSTVGLGITDSTDIVKRIESVIIENEQPTSREDVEAEKIAKRKIAKEEQAKREAEELDKEGVVNEGVKGSLLGTFTTTAYTDNVASQGKWVGQTATGVKPQVGVVAVDPKVIPLGTKLIIEGYNNGKVCVAGDVGGAVKGNIIDVFLNTQGECTTWGRQDKKVWKVNN